MRVVHEEVNKIFQQIIYFDQETEFYYELIRIRGEETVELYMGKAISLAGTEHVTSDQFAFTVTRVVNSMCAKAFPIRKGEHWKTIKARLPSYLIRVSV